MLHRATFSDNCRLIVSMKTGIFSLVVLVIGLNAGDLYGQKGNELGGWIGAAHYFGDLNNLYRLNEPGLAFGGIARHNFNTRFSIQMQLNYARLRGNDHRSSNSFDIRRNLGFYTDVIEINPALCLNFFEYIHGQQGYQISPYMTGGFSVFRFDPRRNVNGNAYLLREIGTEGQVSGQEYGTISGAWTFGAGVKFDLNYRWSINAEINTRLVFTDYLDDVSKQYPDVGQLLLEKGADAAFLSDPSIPDENNQKIGVKGFQRGDSKENDMFITAGVHLLYYFGRLDCPRISVPH